MTMIDLRQYSKTVAAVAGFLALFGNAIANGNVDAAEAGALVTAALTAFGVYQARNRTRAAALVAPGRFQQAREAVAGKLRRS